MLFRFRTPQSFRGLRSSKFSLVIFRGNKTKIDNDEHTTSQSIQTEMDSINLNWNQEINSCTACFLGIGDEFLSGQRRDMNLSYLGGKLKQHGIELHQAIFVSDDEKAIMNALQASKSKFDRIYTSGGIGPKSQQPLYHALQQLLNLNLDYHQPTLDRMEKINQFLSRSSTPQALSARRQLAFLPTSAQIFYPASNLWLPYTIVENIHILPGIPQHFKTLLDASFLMFPTKYWRRELQLVGGKRNDKTFEKELNNLIQKNHVIIEEVKSLGGLGIHQREGKWLVKLRYDYVDSKGFRLLIEELNQHFQQIKILI